MRGEHFNGIRQRRPTEGSSPHARGTRLGRVIHLVASGIIPACAGNTIKYWSVLLCVGDHPRMRGEHTTPHLRHPPCTGSSPHARGTLFFGGTYYDKSGIIPACAGNTRVNTSRTTTCRDHPRMRGEHFISCGDLPFAEGSSPHARGTPWNHPRQAGKTGIIPACAGNTRSRWCSAEPSGDHPRMRGEHIMRTMASASSSGSSPHARGTPSGMLSMSCVNGIIPACAGNTFSMGIISFPCWDHPRMRGEH